MDKKLILAVAGSGKTTHLIKNISSNQRTLIVTYTKANHDNLRKQLIQHFGYYPKFIQLFTYYTFIHWFCYKPYLYSKHKTKGINYRTLPNRFARGIERFVDKYGRLYHHRIAKFLDDENLYLLINNRIEKYFDVFMIDEIQDFAGHDFNFIKNVSKANINFLFVGDFYQHTYDTSRDGNVNKNLHSDIEAYKNKFRELGLSIDESTLSNSYRCSPSICKYISEKIGIEIGSFKSEDTIIEFNEDDSFVEQLASDNNIIKLFYQNRSKYDCNSKNWGECKGENHYTDVCVVLNPKTLKHYKNDNLLELPEKTKNKLYVAVSRANRNLYLIPEESISGFKITV